MNNNHNHRACFYGLCIFRLKSRTTPTTNDAEVNLSTSMMQDLFTKATSLGSGTQPATSGVTGTIGCFCSPTQSY